MKKLSAEDKAYLRTLIMENEKYIKHAVTNTLGPLFEYLADDAVGELYLLACQKVDVIKTCDSPRAWLIVAARYVAKGLIKKQKKDLNSVELTEALNSDDENVFEEAVYRIWLENKIPEKLIDSLTQREREVYIKLHIENKTPKEAAAELGVTVNLVHNVNKNLKDKIKAEIKKKNLKGFY